MTAQTRTEPTAPLGLEPPAGNTRFPLLDPMRGLAAIAVFAYHFEHIAPQRGFFGEFLAHGNIGVAIFFLLSGFLLYRPFVVARQNGKRIGIKRFYVRRLLRIIPAYWFALTAVAVLFGLNRFHDRWWQLYSFSQIYDPKTVFDAGLGPAWSLCIEVSFYALLPLYAVLVTKLSSTSVRSERWLEYLVLAALTLGSLGFHVLIGRSATYANLGFTLPGSFYLFAVGMCAAIISVRQPNLLWLRLAARWPVVFWMIGLALYCGISASVDADQLGSVHPLYGAIALLFVLPAVAQANTRTARILETPLLVQMGVISYAFYLWHTVVIAQLSKQFANDAALVSLSFLTTVAVAFLSFRLVESPFLRLKRQQSSPANTYR